MCNTQIHNPPPTALHRFSAAAAAAAAVAAVAAAAYAAVVVVLIRCMEISVDRSLIPRGVPRVFLGGLARNALPLPVPVTSTGKVPQKGFDEEGREVAHPRG
ncbi:hypothetical protein FRC19_003939 [Serendipita sp. 401]|nr:hypothetical protein FRC19_003939 [Serendipita sp. 401]